MAGSERRAMGKGLGDTIVYVMPAEWLRLQLGGWLVGGWTPCERLWCFICPVWIAAALWLFSTA